MSEQNNKYMQFFKKNIHYIILALIIAAQLAYITFLFVNVKQGYHSDEVWSYGAANSRHRPFLFLEEGVRLQNDGESAEPKTTNYREWISGDVLNDFLVVNKGEQFDYESVYYNQSIDFHPPFYYILLHTICSFFPETFSFVFSYSINVISLIFTQIFLYKTVYLLCRNKAAGLAASAMYALCFGSRLTFLYLRQYALLTMLFTLFIFLNTKLYAEYDPEKGFDLKKYMPGTAVTSFLIFYTNYPSIIFVGAFTAAFCVYLLFTKRIKQMFIYGLSETAALLMLFIAFPAIKDQIRTHFVAEQTFDDLTTFKMMLNYLLSTTLGIEFSFWKSAEIMYIPVIIGVAILIMLPLAFLFRKEEWFVRLSGKLKTALKNIPTKFARANKIPLFSFIGAAALMTAYLKTVDVYHMGTTTVRYLFMLFPIVCMISLCILDIISSHIPAEKPLKTAAVSAAALFVGFNTNLDYERHEIYDKSFQVTNAYGYTDISETVRDANCMALINYDDSSTWLMTCYTGYLRNADNVFFTCVTLAEEDIAAINAEGISVKYILIPQSFLRISDISYIDLMTGYTELNKNINVVVNEESGGDDAEAEEEELIQLDDPIRTLNGGCTFEVRSTVNIQGDRFYLLELSQ